MANSMRLGDNVWSGGNNAMPGILFWAAQNAIQLPFGVEDGHAVVAFAFTLLTSFLLVSPSLPRVIPLSYGIAKA